MFALISDDKVLKTSSCIDFLVGFKERNELNNSRIYELELIAWH